MQYRWLVALVFCACATTQPPPSHPSPTVAADENAAPESAPAAPGSDGPHTIVRGELDKVLNSSPGYFLQHVVTEPQLSNGRFHGWRLISFFPGDTRFAGVDLQAGDVVTRVNGLPIEQPDQFMTVWDRLRREAQLVVDVERNGAPRTLRWTIADK